MPRQCVGSIDYDGAHGMTSAIDTSRVDVIRRDLACPICSYSFNGLSGEVITCPECGAQCDITAMVAARWRGSWREAPGYSRMLWPVAWIGTTCWFILLIYAFDVQARTPPGSGLITAIASAFIVVVWVVLLVRTERQFTQGRGVLLLVLSHVITAAYLAGLIAVVAGLLAAAHEGAAWFFLAAAGAVLMYACFQGEKFMARVCIREHLLATATTRHPAQ